VHIKTFFTKQIVEDELAFAGTLVASALLLSIAATAAVTGTLTLTGSVPQTNSIVITPQTVATGLDLATSQSNLVVANVTESSNDRLGYRVVLNTQNGSTTGLFKGGTGNSDTLAYSVSYNGSPVSFSGGSATVTNTVTRSAVGGTVKAVAITYTGTPGISADNYSDTLIFTMTAN